MRPDALVWYLVACVLVLLRLLCSAEASQWLQQRVQVLVKSLQVQHRQWGARRAASASSQSPEQPAAAEEEREDASEGGSATGGGSAGADASGDAGRPGAASGPRSSLAGRLLRQYTGPDAPAPLRRLKQRFFSVVGGEPPPPPPPPADEEPAEDMRVHRNAPAAAAPADPVPAASSSSASDGRSEDATSSEDARVPRGAEPEPAPSSSASEARDEDAAAGSASAVPVQVPVVDAEEPVRSGVSRVRQRMLSEDLVGARELAPIEEDGAEANGTPTDAATPEQAPKAPADAPAPPTIVFEAVGGEGEGEEGGEGGKEEEVEGEAREGRGLRPLKLRPTAGAAGEDAAAPARKSPVTVQEWVDSLPHVTHSRSEEETEEQVLEDGEEALDLGLGAEAGLLYNGAPIVTVISPQQLRSIPSSEAKLIRRDGLAREPSVQSDVTSHGSHGSSVESYLESRRPDPEEVLLSLGFGGPVSSLDSEVTRIPKRFLQPSKVKGVAIKDFLRHQQELMENFETGFCGYRGLTGSSSSMPSVIVAKIMEKLREHERESIHSAGTSEYASFATTPPPDIARRFSHHSSHHHGHHRHMLKRGSAASSSSPSPSSKQAATLSVLNADNRRFLESQGSKSPEVPRKRMIIGQRSFTFGRDGDLIEVQSPASSREDSSGGPVPLPPLKPLVHKDSVLSSATDLSLTSVDSDSDTDERSGSYDLRRRLRLPQSPVPTTEPLHASTPYSDNCSSPTDLSGFSEIESEKSVNNKIPHKSYGFSKRMSSTSLSSWESDTNNSSFNPLSPPFENSFSRARFTVGDSEMKDDHRHKSSHSLLGNLPIRYESIEEDVEMRTESDVESNFPQTNSSEDSKSRDGLVFAFSESPKESRTPKEMQEMDDSVFTSPPPYLSSKVPVIDEAISATQARRGSLKRQQNVAEDDVPVVISDNHSALDEKKELKNSDNSLPVDDNNIKLSSGYSNNVYNTPEITNSYKNDACERLCVPHTDTTVSEDNLSDFEGIMLPQLEIIDERLFKKNKTNFSDTHNELTDFSLSNSNIAQASVSFQLELAEDVEMIEPSAHLQIVRDIRGDSFEMEEIVNGEEEARAVPLTRARSDSSGFLDGELERHLPDTMETKSVDKSKDNEEVSSSAIQNNCQVDVFNDMSLDERLDNNIPVETDHVSKMEGRTDVSEVQKRLSLPVVCVVDESGGVLLSRSNSLRSVGSDETNSSNGSGKMSKSKKHRTRRVHSAPEPLTFTSSCSSVSNMFSSCSDESVIHMDLKTQCSPIQPTAEGIASTYRSNKDLQELLEELAVRGVNLSQDFEPLFSSRHESQCIPLQADAVRAALNTYSSQLGESMCSLQANSELLECVVDARHELEVVREIREQIAAELRRVAALLEEQPGPRAAAITRQMTVLLREQTRLCRQLEALSNGSLDSSIAISGIPRTMSVSNSSTSSVPCCNSERLLGAVREENQRLERLVQSHSQELAEIRHLLKELVSKQNMPNSEL